MQLNIVKSFDKKCSLKLIILRTTPTQFSFWKVVLSTKTQIWVWIVLKKWVSVYNIWDREIAISKSVFLNQTIIL